MDSSHSTTPFENDPATTTDPDRRGKKSGRPKVGRLDRGTAIGRYTILEHLGSGGMASVYSAYDTQLERIVALKMLRAELEVEEVRARMLREAQAMARLKHQHVVTVYEVGTFENRIYIAMEFVDGTTLSKWSKASRTWRELLEMLKAAGRGLAAAHEAGLVHRDFKPDNVLVGKDGRVLVSDFGIALSQQGPGSGPEEQESELEISETGSRPLAGATFASDTAPDDDSGGPRSSTPGSSSRSATDRLTQEGAVLGTPGFIAPEHLFQSIDDARSDQFSFCVTMYQLLYGTRPFEARNLPTYCDAIQKPPKPPPDSTSVPGWVHAIILRGLQLDPARRFASMYELLAALERDPSKRRRIWALGSLLVAGALAVAGGYAQHRAQLRAQCAAGEGIVRSTWSNETRDRVRASIASAGGSYGPELATRTVQKLDEYGRDWASVYRQVSEAALLRGSETPTILEHRLQCLERGRDAFEVLVSMLSSGEAATAAHALDAAYALPKPEACATAEALTVPALPSSPELRAEALQSEHFVAQASTLLNDGQHAKVISLVQSALPQVHAGPHRRVEAQLLMLQAAAYQRSKGPVSALATYRSAFRAAEASGDDVTAAQAAGQVAFMLANRGAPPAESEEWLAIGHAILQRLGHADEVEAVLLNSQFVVQAAQGHPDIELLDRELAIETRMYGERDPRLAFTISNRAFAHSLLGHVDLAVQDGQKTIDMFESVMGPNAPLTTQYNNLGDSLRVAGRFEDSKAALEHAIALHPTETPDVSSLLVRISLAQLYVRIRQPDAALDAIRDAMKLADALGANGAGYIPFLLVQRGLAHGQKSDFKAEAEDCQRALSLQDAGDKVLIAGSSSDVLTCLGEAEIELRKTDVAIAHLEQSVATLEQRAPDDPADLPIAWFHLAHALRASKRDEVRANDLAHKALDRFRGIAGREWEANAVEHWLRSHAASP